MIDDVKKQFKIVSGLLNRADVDTEMAARIEDWCREQGVPFLGRVPFDPAAQRAINSGRSLADTPCPAREALHGIFLRAMELLDLNIQ